MPAVRRDARTRALDTRRPRPGCDDVDHDGRPAPGDVGQGSEELALPVRIRQEGQALLPPVAPTARRPPANAHRPRDRLAGSTDSSTGRRSTAPAEGEPGSWMDTSPGRA